MFWNKTFLPYGTVSWDFYIGFFPLNNFSGSQQTCLNLTLRCWHSACCLPPPILMDRRWWVYRKKSIMNTNKSANIRQSLRYFLGVSIGITRSCWMKQWRRKTSWHCPFKVIVSRVRDTWAFYRPLFGQGFGRFFDNFLYRLWNKNFTLWSSI